MPIHTVSAVPESKLTPSDLSDVLTLLHCVQHKWLYIGLHLGIPYQKLTEIEHEHCGDQRSMTKMLDIALSQQQTITWGCIITSLCKPNVDEQVYAQKLKSLLIQGTADQCNCLADSPISHSGSPDIINGHLQQRPVARVSHIQSAMHDTLYSCHARLNSAIEGWGAYMHEIWS